MKTLVPVIVLLLLTSCAEPCYHPGYRLPKVYEGHRAKRSVILEPNPPNVFHYLADLSSHIWQTLIIYQMWSAFRPGRVAYSQQSHKTPVVHWVLGWGIPLLLAGIYYFIILTDIVPWLSEELLYRTFPENSGPATTGIVTRILVIQIFELTNMGLCIATLYRLKDNGRESKRLRGAESRRHNCKDVQWSTIFAKVTLIAGVDYIVLNMAYLMLFNIHAHSQVIPVMYITLYNISNLRGVEVFFLFVYKEEWWKYVKNIPMGIVTNLRSTLTQYIYIKMAYLLKRENK